MFGGGEKRKGFVRTAIPGVERTISWIVMLIVLGIGSGIYLKGRSYDPGLFSLDQAFLSQATQPMRQEVRLTGSAEEAVPASVGLKSQLTDLAPEGWRAIGQVEHFPAGDLYVKINGRAEQYLAYDVLALTCVSLADPSDRFIDVFVYDMGTPIHAFGIYSVERAEGQPPVDLGRGGYRSGASIFYWSGPYYVQIIAAGQDAVLMQASDAIASELAGRLADGGEAVWGLAAFPEAGLDPESIQYFLRDALSLDFLGNTFSARYDVDGIEVTAFLSRQSTVAAAGRAFDNYKSYLADYGTVSTPAEPGADRAVLGDMGGYYDVVFLKGDTLCGVTTAEDRAAAEKTAARLLTAIQ